MQSLSTCFRIGATALIVVAVVAAGLVVAPSGATSENPGLEELWDRFPLDDPNASSPSGATREPGAERPVRPVERDAPNAAGRGAATRSFGIVAFVAAVFLLLLGLGAALVRYRGASLRRRKPKPLVRAPARTAAMTPLEEGSVRAPPGPATTVGVLVSTLGGSTQQEQGPVASDPNQWPSPIVVAGDPHAPLPRLEDSRDASVRPRPLMDAPTALADVDEEGGSMPEIDVLKAKLGGANSSKPAAIRADVEVELLKRKPAADHGAVKTKAKPVIDKERLDRRDTRALKEKLADVHTPPARVPEAWGDNSSTDRDTRQMGASRAEAPGLLFALVRDYDITIGDLAFGLIAAVSAAVVAVLLVSLLYY